MQEKSVALGLFDGYGIELEYMIVDRDTLQIRPLTDTLMKAVAGEIVGDFERGDMGWSNELVNHVLEFKVNQPVKDLAKLPKAFLAEITHANTLLEPMGAMLMPTGMHPFMVPAKETVLWSHESNEIYSRYNEIFDCRGHGWSNLQSHHINLPFRNDQEFGALHAAIRLILPLLPALAASSPVVEGKLTGAFDNRLQFYRNNSIRVPSVSGLIVPEPAFTRKDYEIDILARLYQDISPHDPEGILQHEWANARGAIARFTRGAIEIRLLDVQESAQADIAIAMLVAAVLKALVHQKWCTFDQQKAASTKKLAEVLRGAIVQGFDLVVEDPDLLRLWVPKPKDKMDMREIWSSLLQETWPQDVGKNVRTAAEAIVREGSLSQRIIKALHKDTDQSRGGDGMRGRQREIYRELCRCLATGRLFVP